MGHILSSQDLEDLVVNSAGTWYQNNSMTAGRAALIAEKGNAAERLGLEGKAWLYSVSRWFRVLSDSATENQRTAKLEKTLEITSL